MRNYLTEEISQNELMSKKHKDVNKVLNYTEQLIILITTVTGWVSIYAFVSLIGISLGITSSAIGLKTFVITAGINEYKQIIKKKKKKHDKMVLLSKYKLNSIEVFIYKALTD